MPTDSYTDRLADHAFVRAVIEANKPFVEEAAERATRALAAGKLVSDEPANPSELNAYINAVLRYVGAVFDAIERMSQSRVYVESYPRPKYYEHKGLTRFSWLEYHYAYYLVTMVGLSDISVLLTNAVFRLGMKPRDAKFELIAKNEWVEGADVTLPLRQIKAAADQHRELRNQHIHAGESLQLHKVLDDDLVGLARMLESTSHILRRSGSTEHSDLGEREMIVALGFNATCQQLSTYIGNEINSILALLETLFDKLLPMFNYRVAMITVEGKLQSAARAHKEGRV